jgi:histidyl-tRNA synthetase
MTSIIEPRNLKGFRDYAPKDQLVRQAMFAKIQNVFERFGFLPLSTPVLEYKEILMGKIGEEERLIYSFKDNGERDVAMRYDLTVPLARFVAQNQGSLTFPFKRYQIAPVWRAENTQKGRLREFYQCDIDTLGTRNEFLGLADAEVIACLASALESLGVTNYIVRISDRMLFNELTESPADEQQLPDVLRSIDKLEKIGLEGVKGVLEEKGVNQALQNRVLELLSWGRGEEVLQRLAEKSDSAAARVKFWRQLLAMVEGLGVAKEKLVFDPSITRGLDYYTSTVFEFSLSASEGFGSIGGGGRYNDLLKTFSKDTLPAVGGSLGIDRLYEYLESTGQLQSQPGLQVVVLNMGLESGYSEILKIVTNLRVAGINTDIYLDSVKLDIQFKYAESKGAEAVVIFGEEEKQSGNVQVKWLATREQDTVKMEDLSSFLSSRLNP